MARNPIPHVRRAVSYVNNPSERNRTAAFLWIGVALLGLWMLRNKSFPDPRQAATGAVAIGAIVFVGSFVPKVVTWVLIALLAAATLGAAPQLTALLAQLQAKGLSVSLRGQ